MPSSYSGRMAGAQTARRDMEADRAFDADVRRDTEEREYRRRRDSVQDKRYQGERDYRQQRDTVTDNRQTLGDAWDRASQLVRQRRESEVADRNRQQFDLEYGKATEDVQREREEAAFGAWPKFVYGVASGMDPEVVKRVYNASAGDGPKLAGFKPSPDGGILLDFGDGNERAIRKEQVEMVMGKFSGERGRAGDTDKDRVAMLEKRLGSTAIGEAERNAIEDELQSLLDLPPIDREAIATAAEKMRLQEDPDGSMLGRSLIGRNTFGTRVDADGRDVTKPRLTKQTQPGTGVRGLFNDVSEGKQTLDPKAIKDKVGADADLEDARSTPVEDSDLFDLSGMNVNDIERWHDKLSATAKQRDLGENEIRALHSILAWADANKAAGAGPEQITARRIKKDGRDLVWGKKYPTAKITPVK